MPFLSEFRFCDFRGFMGESCVFFAIPTEKDGSGITYVVGENNSGKTSVLEAMAFRGVRRDGNNYYGPSSELRTSDVKSDNVEFSFYDIDHNLVENLQLVRPRSFILHDGVDTEKPGVPPIFLDFAPLFVPARRYWSPRVGGLYHGDEVSMRDYTQGNLLRQTPDGQIMQQQLANVFYKIELDDRLYDEYIETIRKIFPDFESFTVTNEDTKSVSYVMGDGVRHRSDFLGEGVSSVMCILAYLIAHDDCMLIIDEPELSLHPLAQKRLIRVIASYAKSRQIMISTHSPYMVKWEYIESGAKLNRVVKTGNKAQIFHLGAFSDYKPLIIGANWQQPFLADEISREIFFHDNVLFVEGQDDVGLLRQDGVLFDDINIFGYGVRGFSNFPFALKLAYDIGVKKVGVLIDKGKNEDVVAKQLRADFSGYLVCQWEREDIRDKTGYCELGINNEPDLKRRHLPKEGYFTVKGKKKPPEQLGDYDKVIGRINDYFSDRG